MDFPEGQIITNSGLSCDTSGISRGIPDLFKIMPFLICILAIFG
jgi:hypothetical protein